MSLFYLSGVQASDVNGKALASAKWKFYESGGSTPAVVYAENTLATSLGSTVTASIAGWFVPIFLDDTVTYRARLETTAGALVGNNDIDPVNGSGSVTNFDEQVRDIIAATLIAGENINVDNDDAGNTTTISAPLGGIQSLAPARSGVFFDTALGDTFNGAKFSAPADATLTINPTTLVFSSATQKDLQCFIKDSSGSVMQHCFDSFNVDATYTVTSFPSAGIEGVLTGMNRDNAGANIRYGTMLSASGSGAAFALAHTYNSDAQLASGSNYAFGAPFSVRVQYQVRGTAVTSTTSYPSTADEVLTLTQVFTATSYEVPRLLSKLGLQFRQGVITCTALKVSASYPNATYALVGDSLTQGKFASVHANGWGAKLRVDYPDDVIIAGASGATTANWLNATQTIIDMGPRYALVCLGVNDILLARAIGDIQTDYREIMDRFTAAGITPVAISVPPINSALAPTMNAWIASQGWLYIDIYSTLVGTGNALNATFDSGDTVHWNNAGHNAVYGAVTSAISSLGLTVPVNSFFVDSDTTLAADSDSRVATQKATKAHVSTQRGSGTSALGYGTGAGGTVTQATSKATGVTLSEYTGRITLNNAALAADTTVSFVLTNTTIAAGDLLILNHVSGGTAGAYTLNGRSAAGSATIDVRNVTAGSLGEAIVIGYAVFRGQTT